MDGALDMDVVEKCWNQSSRNEVRRLQKDENGLTGMFIIQILLRLAVILDNPLPLFGYIIHFPELRVYLNLGDRWQQSSVSIVFLCQLF